MGSLAISCGCTHRRALAELQQSLGCPSHPENAERLPIGSLEPAEVLYGGGLYQSQPFPQHRLKEVQYRISVVPSFILDVP